MRSRARLLAGHPLHPMLVPFPLAFCIGAAAFDVIGVQMGLPGWYTASKYLLGVGLVAGLAAAIPGLVDCIATVPARGGPRRRARRHMFANSAALGLAAFAFWIRGAPGVAPDPPVVALEVVVALLLLWSGFLGGGLVYRDGIAVEAAEATDGIALEDAEGD